MNFRMLESDGTTLCVIGAGPRGLSVVERVCANAAATGQRAVCTSSIRICVWAAGSGG